MNQTLSTMPANMASPAAVVPAGSRQLGARIVSAVGMLFARWRAARRQQRELDQLAAMSDRELADIGIARSDLPRIHTGQYAAEQQELARVRLLSQA